MYLQELEKLQIESQDLGDACRILDTHLRGSDDGMVVTVLAVSSRYELDETEVESVFEELSNSGVLLSSEEKMCSGCGRVLEEDDPFSVELEPARCGCGRLVDEFTSLQVSYRWGNRPKERESVPKFSSDEFQFLVSFSFAGANRVLVKTVAEAVAERLGKERVFFDDWYAHEIGGQDRDLYCLLYTSPSPRD